MKTINPYKKNSETKNLETKRHRQSFDAIRFEFGQIRLTDVLATVFLYCTRTCAQNVDTCIFKCYNTFAKIECEKTVRRYHPVYKQN